MILIFGYNKEVVKKYGEKIRDSIYYKIIVEIKGKKNIDDSYLWWKNVLDAFKKISEYLNKSIQKDKYYDRFIVNKKVPITIKSLLDLEPSPIRKG